MTRLRYASALVLVALVCSTHALLADVRSDQKTRFEFAGMLGRMVNFFGGKGAKEGVTSSVAVRGDRKATTNDETGQIIDLSEEKVYDLDLKKKTYKVTTFAELRRRMEESQKKAEENVRKQQPTAASPRNPDEKQMEVDVDIKNTGETRTINGFNTRETVMTITLREKGKTVEQGGGMILTTDSWLAPKIPAMKEIMDFDIRYAQKLYGGMLAGVSADQMATAMALYPMMKQAMGRMNVEGGKLEGTSILTTMTMDAVKADAEMEQQAKQQEDDSKPAPSGGVNGFLSGLAKKAAAKKAGGDDGAKQRATFMTSTIEVLKVATDLSAADVAIPAGFKENK
jgi:hypothetical protein